jgi:hypothetical protein
MEQPVTEVQEPTTLQIKAWPDPVIDQLGFDPASGYVELTGAVAIFKSRQCFAVSVPDTVK